MRHVFFILNQGLKEKSLILFAVRDGLCGQVFSGWYTERRFIDPIER